MTLRKKPPQSFSLTPVGWREWVGIPAWGVDFIKAKVDTGARTSSLHADDLEFFESEGRPWVRFTLHPWQTDATQDSVRNEAMVVTQRSVRSSSGHEEMRPVVIADLTVAGVVFQTELTLTNRDEMGFRMLLGRRALSHRFVVDPGESYLGGVPPKSIRMRNRGRS